jgi:type I restriction enzyme, S subunit
MISYSIIQKSQLEGALRLDAEYYQPEYLDVEKKLNAVKTESLENLSESILSFGAYSLTSNIEWQDAGVTYLNVGDIHEGYIDYSDVKYISEKVDKILQKSQIKEGEIVLTMAGTIGNAAVVHNIKTDHINGNQAIAKIKLKKSFSPYYLAAFLNSRYGQLQTWREIVSSVQANIFLGQIKKFKIPIFNVAMTKSVESSYLNFLKELENSKSLYSQAENLLLEELGLKDFESENELSNIVNFSDIKSVNRIDAEYFLSKCERILSKIKKLNLQSLGDLVSIKKGIEPGAEAYQEAGKFFVRVSSLSKDGVIDKNQKYLSNDLYQKLKEDFEPKEILLTKDATPGIAYVLKESIEGIVSGGILRLKHKENIDNEYLALCINSIIGQSQVERDAGGSIIKHWKPEQVKNLQVPILPKSTQQKIADLVRKSHEARKKAKQLLEEAKQKVEAMIEK